LFCSQLADELLVRLDIFLKLSRLCPRRTLAQELCDAGFVLLNGRPAKSAHTINAGDELSLRRRDREITARVLRVPATNNVSRRDADQLVEIISEQTLDSPHD
jgi:ribosomal 50S subunit-recycling heat shock protein